MGAILIIVVILIIVIIVLSNSEVKKKKTDYYTAAQFSLEREKSRRPNEYIYKEKSQNVSFDISFEKSTKSVGKYLIIDCETTGMPISQNASIHTLNNWPRIVQLAWFVFDIEKKLLKSYSSIINPGVEIPQQAVSIHKITTARVKKEGEHPIKILRKLKEDLKLVDTIVAHNINFDIPIIESEFIRNGFGPQMLGKDKICTMESSTNIVRIPKNYGRGWKWPKLEELTGFLFYNNYDVQIPGVHDAEMDSLLTAKCFFKLKEEYQITIRKGQKNFISNNSDPKLPEEIIIPEITQWPRKNEKLSKDPILLKEYNSLRNQFSKSYSKLYNDDGLQNLSGIEREKEEIKLSLTTENLEMFIKDHFEN